MRLVLGDRVGGGSLLYRCSDEESLMRVPDEIKKCVAFVQYQDAAGVLHFCGTAFFVGLRAKGAPNRVFIYAVTALHVVEHVKQKAADGLVRLRINLCDSTTHQVGVPIQFWYYHPSDDSVDVAIASLSLLPDWDLRYYPQDAFVTDDLVKEKSIGIGDEVFLMGLFVHHKETEKNVPIMRVGNIAAMSDEPIRTKGQYFDEMEGYLIETRSIAGVSGCPVFVNLQAIRNLGGSKGTVLSFHNGPLGGSHLLGLVHGHWGLSVPDSDPHTKDIKLHTGISIVVPAKKILEVICHPDLQAKREKEEARLRAEIAATPDLS